MKMEEMAARWILMAREMNKMNEFGALHIVVADGNVDDDNIEFCLNEATITPAERAFAMKLMLEFNEEERAAIYALTHGEES